MTSYYDDLARVKAAGKAYAETGIRYGSYVPEEGLFSGEWADGLTGQDALNQAGIEATFSELEDFEQTDVLDSFEDGYYSADWPQAHS